MLSRSKTPHQSNLFFGLAESLNIHHPLYVLADKIDWKQFDVAFAPLFCEDNGRPAKPIRLMVGLLILKHLRNVSDESVVEQWSENIYYQYLCGEQQFVPGFPCNASELVHFRKRIGEAGVMLILQESIRINGDDSNDPDVSMDTTVQEKNITFPTDNKLHRKIIAKCLKIATTNSLRLRQSYTSTLKQLSVAQRFRNHPTNKAKARKVKTIAGRLVREMERRLEPNSRYQTELELFKKVPAQKRSDGNKTYSLHEPDVQCISRGKENKKYEFGNKVSIVYIQQTGVIAGTKSFRNEYDGHTLEPVLEQVKELLGKCPKTATATKVGNAIIQIPKPFNNKKQSKYQQRKLRKTFGRRAGIEPVFDHLKSDHRLSRNFYKGILGDNINVMLSAAAFNFKRMMNQWSSFSECFCNIFSH